MILPLAIVSLVTYAICLVALLELAALPAEQRLSAAEVAEIRAIGDNAGSMVLKGASPEHEGDERPDRWQLNDDLAAVGSRWGIDPERDLVSTR